MIDDGIENFYQDIRKDLGGSVGFDDTHLQNQIDTINNTLENAVTYDHTTLEQDVAQLKTDVKNVVTYDDEEIWKRVDELTAAVKLLGGYNALDVEQRIKDLEHDMSYHALPDILTLQIEMSILENEILDIKEVTGTTLWDFISDILDALFGGPPDDENDYNQDIADIYTFIWETREWTWDLFIGLVEEATDAISKTNQTFNDRFTQVEQDLVTGLEKLATDFISQSGPGSEGPRGPSGPTGSRGPPGKAGPPGAVGPKASLAEIDVAIFHHLDTEIQAQFNSTADVIDYIYAENEEWGRRVIELTKDMALLTGANLDARVTLMEDDLKRPEILMAEIIGIDVARWEVVASDLQSLIAKILTIEGR